MILKRLGLALVVVMISLMPAVAGTIDLGSFDGADVMFNDVMETNDEGPGGAAINYYQDLEVIVNTLVINPVDFRVQTVGGPVIDFLDSQLETVIMAKGDSVIETIKFEEFGDYEIAGFENDDARVKAEVAYLWQVLAGPNITNGGGTVSFEDVTLPNDSGLWSLDFNIDISDLAPGTTKVRFEFDNKLTAQSQGAGLAFIAKKQIPGIRITVPEPASFLLALLGVVALMRFRLP